MVRSLIIDVYGAYIMTNGQERHPDRRGFFQQAWSRALGPAVDYVAQRFDIGAVSSSPSAAPTWLRPPGAADESSLNDLCHRCGACVEVCPAKCLVPLPAKYGVLAGTPAIDPDVSACVVCEGLQCTHVCPSKALSPVNQVCDMAMGLAEVYEPVCVRSQGESCTVCVDRCPLGSKAIFFAGDGPPTVLTDGCVGCGLCQLFCPTQPKAITVTPTATIGVAGAR